MDFLEICRYGDKLKSLLYLGDLHPFARSLELLAMFTKSIFLNQGMKSNQTRIVYGSMILTSQRDDEHI